MNKQKAELWLVNNPVELVRDDTFGSLNLYLKTPTKLYLLWCEFNIPDDDIEKYKDCILNALNEVASIRNGLVIDFKVDESVSKFMPDNAEEINKLISMLTKEL